MKIKRVDFKIPVDRLAVFDNDCKSQDFSRQRGEEAALKIYHQYLVDKAYNPEVVHRLNEINANEHASLDMLKQIHKEQKIARNENITAKGGPSYINRDE